MLDTLNGEIDMISRMGLAVSIIFWLAAMCAVSAPASAQSITPEALPPAIELVRTTVANEVAAANDSSVKHMFRDYKNPRKDRRPASTWRREKPWPA